MKIRLLFAVPLLAMALASCGAKADEVKVASANGTAEPAASAPAAAAAPTDQREASLKFAQCMRQNGVDMPDPDPNGPITMMERPGDAEKTKKAQEACKQFLQASVGEKGKGVDADKLDMLVKLAQCMRQQGIDMPDPSADGKVEISIPPGTPEEKVKAAHEACKDYSAGMPLQP
ncbi:hypothetical protein SAMN05421505_1514 [Sinosporangium album]|uniref:Secreted protein n=1 Tax=Sinosporangium album TaxID=504805 RepID=A0A1G8KHL3_9ACTN|nr:hypothetical protein [Sinosporangium album]SDI42894.1 hypothetical protein SAMN05421505_1514 [Sinosporangium album]